MSEEEKAYCTKITGLPARGAPSYNERVKQENRRRDGKERGAERKQAAEELEKSTGQPGENKGGT